jgi:hypothetical protein
VAVTPPPYPAPGWATTQVYPAHGRRVTHRAAFGGALTARELGLGKIWFLPLFVSTLSYGDASQWPYILWCFLPE